MHSSSSAGATASAMALACLPLASQPRPALFSCNTTDLWVTRPSLLFAGGCKTFKSRAGFRLSSQGESNILANYGIKEYGTPLPPYEAAVKKTNRVEPSKVVSSGGREIPTAWSYGTPKSLRDYTGPGSYGAPKNYGVPAYSASARVAAVEVDEVITFENFDVIVEEVEPELEGGDGGAGKERGDGGGGGGGDGNGAGKGEEEPARKLSMSQKLTLAYAAVVGVGGLIGYAKSGSSKSLMTGVGTALVLIVVFAQLPTNPTFASGVGFGVSVVLLGTMGQRFKNSGKFMPAGLVALLSLIMTGGYLHGIMRTSS